MAKAISWILFVVVFIATCVCSIVMLGINRNIKLDLDKANEKNQALLDDNNNLKAKCEKLEFQIEDYKIQISTLKNEKGDLNEENQTLKSQKATLESEKQILQQENQTLTERVSELENSISEKEQEIQRLTTQIEEGNANNEQLQQEKTQLQIEKQKLETEKQTLTDRVSELETSIAQKDGQISSLQTQVAQKEQRISELESQIETLNSRISELEEEIRKLKASLTEDEEEDYEVLDFVFNGNTVTEYTGNETEITIPSSYSIKTKKVLNKHLGLYTEDNLATLVNEVFNYPNKYTTKTDSLIIGDIAITSIEDYQSKKSLISSHYNNVFANSLFKPKSDVFINGEVKLNVKGTDYHVEKISDNFGIGKGGLFMAQDVSLYDFLTKITIEEGITSANLISFALISNLQTLILPSTLTNITFKTSLTIQSFNKNFNALTHLEISDDNPVYSDCNNNSILDTTTQTLILGNNEGTISGTVKTLGEYCFTRKTFSAINIPTGVEKIGERAFYYCETLTTVTLPETLTTIGERAFYCCETLTTVTLPQSLTTIGNHAFYETALTEINIPQNLTVIGTLAFCSIKTLTSITVSPLNEKFKDYGANVLVDVENKKLITGCKQSTIPAEVEIIGESAFRNCGLTAITIPTTVKTLETNSFYANSDLVINYSGSTTQFKQLTSSANTICVRGDNVQVKCDNGTLTYDDLYPSN